MDNNIIIPRNTSHALEVDCVDELVIHGVHHILAQAESITSPAGSAQQAYGVKDDLSCIFSFFGR